MLQFIIGLSVGGFLGFAICVICTMAGKNDKTDTPCDQGVGEEDVESKQPR